MSNPFAVFSPEGLGPDEVVDLFVINSPGVDAIQSDGHAMLVGARGAGKSMLLRFLEPDCQKLSRRASDQPVAMTAIPYYAAYMTIRETELHLPSLSILEKSHANIPLNEHLLVLTVALSILSRAQRNGHFSESSGIIDEETCSLLESLQLKFFTPAADSVLKRGDRETTIVEKFITCLSLEHDQAIEYFNRMAIEGEAPPFERRLFRFSGFLEPFIAAYKKFPSMPSSGRFFLAMDDADRLSDVQTRILNTWLGRRNIPFSIKVSYEIYGFKTFYTTVDTRIEPPHDYQEIRITDVYTSNKKTNYRDRMRQMIGRRLARAGIVRGSQGVPDVDDFFPEDHSQKIAIARLQERKKTELLTGKGRSLRGRDDLYRYVLPDYMVSLGGMKKNRNTYRYCGFEQLVDISSGVPRYFLEAAHKMYDRQIVRQRAGLSVSQISPEVQDSVVRDLAAELFMDELEKLRLDRRANGSTDIALMLHNFVACLGALFERIMNDASLSERRFFSFALSEHPDSEVEQVLQLGLRYAYFSRSSIGRKEGFGRTEKYVLSRRFAPHWNLDPSGFSAYKFMTNSDIRVMMRHPNQFRLKLRREGSHSEIAGQLEIPLDDEDVG